MKKLNVFVFTTFNKNDSNMYLKKINVNAKQIFPVSKNIDIKDIYKYIEKKVNGKLKKSNKDKLDLLQKIDIVILTSFDKILKQRLNKIADNYNFLKVKKFLNSSQKKTRKKSKTKKKRSLKGGNNDCDTILEEVIKNMNPSDISLDFKQFNNILSKCDKLSNIHSVGFIIVNDIEKTSEMNKPIEKLFNYTLPMKQY